MRESTMSPSETCIAGASPLVTLIVEDNPADARLVQLALAENPYCEFATTVVQDIAAAVAACRSLRFDVLLLDLTLPDSSGLKTLGIMLAETDAPIVVSTGARDDKLGFDAIQAGAADFVPKSESSSHALCRVMAYAVEHNRLRRQLEESNRVIRSNREMAALSSISGSSPTKVTATAIAERPFREAAPEKFQLSVSKYYDVILLAIDEKQYKQTIISRTALRQIAEMLGGWRCGPRDVIDIHVAALRDEQKSEGGRSPKLLAEEPRFLLIELLGYLALYYRNLAIV